jgi:predicted metal-dependent HD superfamily phosphohydrolase
MGAVEDPADPAPIDVEAALARWIATFEPLGVAAERAEPAFVDVVARYAEPQRRYHTLPHVLAVLTTLDTLLAARAPTTDALDATGAAGALRLAGWLHDVVYDPRSTNNEVRSARYARKVLDGLAVPAGVVAETARLIELTAGHKVAADDVLGSLLADADLAILGASPADYERYAAGIRIEYAHVDPDVFALVRRSVLDGFLRRPRLFLTDEMHATLDAAARANLQAELDQLVAHDLDLEPPEVPAQTPWYVEVIEGAETVEADGADGSERAESTGPGPD